MNQQISNMINLGMVAVLSVVWLMPAQNAKAQDDKSPYPSMAPIEQYRMERNAEIALARTAAPASVSRDAEVWVLGQKNYETGVKGTNGFVCLVARAWMSPFESPEFWNPKNRSPECYNAPAARSVLPYTLKRTEMVLAGFSRTQVLDGIKAAVAKKELGAPASGAMCYMMSKEAYLTDKGTHNLAHVMFEVARMDGTNFGADQPDTPIGVGPQNGPEPMTELIVAVGNWSDGTAITTDGQSASDSQQH